MTPDEVVRAFFATLANEGRGAAASRYMAADVALEMEGEPPTVGRDGWLARQGMFEASFPDMHETPIIERVEGNTVYGTNSVTATHTGDLGLSAMGVGIISPTNRRASMDIEVAWTVENDRITHMATVLPGGPAALLRQLCRRTPRPELTHQSWMCRLGRFGGAASLTLIW